MLKLPYHNKKIHQLNYIFGKSKYKVGYFFCFLFNRKNFEAPILDYMEKNAQQGICAENIYAAFFKANVKNLANYLYYKFGNVDQANDIAQDAFIKLWENCANVPPEKAKAFLYTVANNASLNQIAHQKVVLKYAQHSDSGKSNSESPEFILEEKQFKDKLQNAIGNLSEAQRTAFLMNRIDGKKYTEIAEMLGISIKAVEKRIHGALVSLRAEIENIR